MTRSSSVSQRHSSTLTERSSGWLQPRELRLLRHGIVLAGRPMQYVTVGLQDRSWKIPFMLDTGADVTILQPRDAHHVLGAHLFEIDFADSETSLNISGVGVGGTRCSIRTARYSFRTDRGRHYQIDAPILIAEPIPLQVSNEGNWNKISTLGRDILHRVSFRLDYRSEQPVSLELRE